MFLFKSATTAPLIRPQRQPGIGAELHFIADELQSLMIVVVTTGNYQPRHSGECTFDARGCTCITFRVSVFDSPASLGLWAAARALAVVVVVGGGAVVVVGSGVVVVGSGAAIVGGGVLASF